MGKSNGARAHQNGASPLHNRSWPAESRNCQSSAPNGFIDAAISAEKMLIKSMLPLTLFKSLASDYGWHMFELWNCSISFPNLDIAMRERLRKDLGRTN